MDAVLGGEGVGFKNGDNTVSDTRLSRKSRLSCHDHGLGIRVQHLKS